MDVMSLCVLHQAGQKWTHRVLSFFGGGDLLFEDNFQSLSEMESDEEDWEKLSAEAKNTPSKMSSNLSIKLSLLMQCVEL